MRRLVRVVCAIGLLAVLAGETAEGQQPGALPPPSPIPLQTIQNRCRNVDTFIGGRMDDFAAPADPATFSPGLQARRKDRTFVGYDTAGRNRYVGDSFRLRDCKRCSVCSAVLELRVRYTTLDRLTLNDAYFIGTASPSGNTAVASAPVWRQNDPKTKTLTIALPAAPLQNILCGGTGWLDVWVQDETIVDWMRVTIAYSD